LVLHASERELLPPIKDEQSRIKQEEWGGYQDLDDWLYPKRRALRREGALSSRGSVLGRSHDESRDNLWFNI